MPLPAAISPYSPAVSIAWRAARRPRWYSDVWLDGLRSARRGPYRVVYEIVETLGEVHVLRIDHRADVHRPR